MESLFSAARLSVATALLNPTGIEPAGMPGDPCVAALPDASTGVQGDASVGMDAEVRENVLVHIELSASTAAPLIRDAALDAGWLATALQSSPAGQNSQPMKTRSLLADLGSNPDEQSDPVFDPSRSIISQLFNPHPILEGLLDDVFNPGLDAKVPG